MMPMPPAPVLVPDVANRAAAVRALTLKTHRPVVDSLPGRRIRPGQALAAQPFRRTGLAVPARRLSRLDRRLAQRQDRGERRRPVDGRGQAASARPHGQDRPRHRHRSAVDGRAGREQRLRADARGGGGRRPGGRAVRLVVARVHAAALAARPHREDRHRMQSLLQARMPARPLQVHARSAALDGLQFRARRDAAASDGAPRRDDRILIRTASAMPKGRTPPIYTSPQDAALAFYQAFEAKDIDAMMAAWADDEEIVSVHPGGARHVGYDAVRGAFESCSPATASSRSGSIRWS